VRRVALTAGLVGLAASGLGAALVLTAAGAHAVGQSSSAPLTLTIYPPTTTVAPIPTPLAPAGLLNLLAAGQATTLDARLRQPLETLLASRPSLARELTPISASPAAEAVVLLASLDSGLPVMDATAPLVSRMAYDAAHVSDPAQAAGVLLRIELLTRAAALMQGGRS